MLKPFQYGVKPDLYTQLILRYVGLLYITSRKVLHIVFRSVR